MTPRSKHQEPSRPMTSCNAPVRSQFRYSGGGPWPPPFKTIASFGRRPQGRPPPSRPLRRPVTGFELLLLPEFEVPLAGVPVCPATPFTTLLAAWVIGCSGPLTLDVLLLPTAVTVLPTAVTTLPTTLVVDPSPAVGPEPV